MDVLTPAERRDDSGEELIRLAMVERHVRRRAHDHQHALPVDVQCIQDSHVRIEVGQVVLLLEARLLP
jgi:hypothetical protein